MVLLLRIVEVESGSVLIDGVDVRGVGLHTLRGAVAVVPQEPFLLEGTIAMNLDPMFKHTKEELVHGLSRVGLGSDLESEVGKGGGRLSAGERQLLAIARATLGSSHVVVMDEPTASCDASTDTALQELIREAFTGRTVLCIAHRLKTIMSYDRVLVMEAGTAAELGTPPELLSEPMSRFAGMVAAMSRAVQ